MGLLPSNLAPRWATAGGLGQPHRQGRGERGTLQRGRGPHSVLDWAMGEGSRPLLIPCFLGAAIPIHLCNCQRADLVPGGLGWPWVTLADGTRAINLPGPVLSLQLNEGWLGGARAASLGPGQCLAGGGEMETCGSANRGTMKARPEGTSSCLYLQLALCLPCLPSLPATLKLSHNS